MFITDEMKVEIKKNAPTGAKGFMVGDDKVYYFIKSNFGWRQINSNLIQFDDSYVDDQIQLLKDL